MSIHVIFSVQQIASYTRDLYLFFLYLRIILKRIRLNLNPDVSSKTKSLTSKVSQNPAILKPEVILNGTVFIPEVPINQTL